MSSSLRVNTIVPSTGTNVAIGTANGTVTFIDSVNFVLGTGSSIFSPASNTLTFGTNDAERLRITSDGKVGINQSTPQTTFHSTGTTNGQQATFGIDDSGLKISTFQKTDNDAGVILDAQKSSNGTLTFATAGTERLRITSGGNIGIGENNPSTVLHVAGSLTLENSSATGNAWTYYKNADRTWLVGVRGSSNDALSFYDLTTDVERLRITSAGDMGLGTASPRSITNFGSFAINGTAGAFTDYFLNGTRTGTTAVDSNGFTSEAVGSSTPFRVITNGSERLRIHSSGVAQFTTTGTQYASASVPAFVVNSNGDHALVLNNQNTTDPRGLFIYQDQDVNNGTSYFLRARAGGTDRAHLYSNGTLQLHSGNLKLASGNGIDFSADGNAGGMSSEVLDDYEEGTWTPVMNKSGVGGTAGTPSTGVGYYRKVGNLLWISFYWYKGSGGFGNNAGEWYVSGLPFLLAHGTGSGYQFIPGGYNNINGTNYQNQSNRWQSNNTNGSATLAMYGPNSTTNWTSGYAEFSASGCLMVP